MQRTLTLNFTYMLTKIFNYYLSKNNKKAAMKIKKAFYEQSLPHKKDIRRKRKMNEVFKKLKERE